MRGFGYRFSRFDAGSAQLIAEDTSVAAAVQGCLHARNWAGVYCTVPDGLVVRLDRRRFDVILANLVGNALRHGAPPVTVPNALGAGRHLMFGLGRALQPGSRRHGTPTGRIVRRQEHWAQSLR